MNAVHDPALLEKLEARGFVEWGGEAWRYVIGEREPVRVNTQGARWNPPNCGALYASVERATAVAEGEHILAMQPVRPTVVRKLYRLRMNLRRVIDLTSEAALAEVGLTMADVRSASFAACQRVGGAAQFLGADGLLVPSARAPGVNLVVFPNETDADSGIEPLPGPEEITS